MDWVVDHIDSLIRGGAGLWIMVFSYLNSRKPIHEQKKLHKLLPYLGAILLATAVLQIALEDSMTPYNMP